ncbi:hypothetical protein K2X30_06230 [bacterium]|jgi:hypothetical protein|nr:hypothetical protein [bacterium]
MKKVFRFTMSTLAVLMSSQAMAGGLIHDRRCDNWNDSLTGPEATPRFEWAIKCEMDRIRKNDITSAYRNGLPDAAGNVSVAYPTYGYFNPASNNYENPANWFAPPKSGASSSSCDIRPANYDLAFYCAAGCMTPEQKILTSHGEVAYEEAFDQEVASVRTLTADSSLENLKFQDSKIDQIVTDIKAGHQKILNFNMASGGSLRVTVHHPLVNRDGKVVKASEIQIGDDLVKENGELDAVVSIVPEDYFGKVYNVKVSDNGLKENIVVAQGYLNGSVRYQNEFVKDLNRDLLRSVVATQLMK